MAAQCQCNVQTAVKKKTDLSPEQGFLESAVLLFQLLDLGIGSCALHPSLTDLLLDDLQVNGQLLHLLLQCLHLGLQSFTLSRKIKSEQKTIIVQAHPFFCHLLIKSGHLHSVRKIPHLFLSSLLSQLVFPCFLATKKQKVIKIQFQHFALLLPFSLPSAAAAGRSETHSTCACIRSSSGDKAHPETRAHPFP